MQKIQWKNSQLMDKKSDSCPSVQEHLTRVWWKHACCSLYFYVLSIICMLSTRIFRRDLRIEDFEKSKFRKRIFQEDYTTDEYFFVHLQERIWWNVISLLRLESGSLDLSDGFQLQFYWPICGRPRRGRRPRKTLRPSKPQWDRETPAQQNE